MKLNPKQIKHLRKLGHSLSPVVTVADRGLIETVMLAIEEALEFHELIKVKVRLQRDQRLAIYEEICKKTGAHLVQTIGMVLLIYRPTKQAVIDLPGPKLKANGKK
ncbi:MAG: ribosome assembly RNA-binding protein YhbY [Gammaproteobacteria bacterium]|nr:MAG: ribosome assembly RNA-binding protein YhbY [Gammaproteobacteria bacterium]